MKTFLVADIQNYPSKRFTFLVNLDFYSKLIRQSKQITSDGGLEYINFIRLNFTEIDLQYYESVI